eukprot:TRINITY_DN2527_c0_g1_i1.p1 TRINITY_DN2527_c0_g1~~TRINITY_DN2527_c0_g1_i1.p1  ORF type:complete len:105 (+),score=7.14 TRINITY_DN2527_c0_g1_i1:172-486(+)
MASCTVNGILFPLDDNNCILLSTFGANIIIVNDITNMAAVAPPNDPRMVVLVPDATYHTTTFVNIAPWYKNPTWWRRANLQVGSLATLGGFGTAIWMLNRLYQK